MGRTVGIPSCAWRSWKMRNAFPENLAERSIDSSSRRQVSVGRPCFDAARACALMARRSFAFSDRLNSLFVLFPSDCDPEAETFSYRVPPEETWKTSYSTLRFRIWNHTARLPHIWQELDSS